MKTVTIIKQVFDFSELSKEAQEKAISYFRENNYIDFEFYANEIIDDHRYQLETVFGFYRPEINYSGFWSQGDGASFTSYKVDIEKFLKATKKWSLYKRYIPSEASDYYVSIERRNYHYCHETTVRASLYRGHFTTENKDFKAQEIRDLIGDFVQDYSRTIYKDLENDYDHLTSDQSIIELIESNGYEFNQDGSLA